MTITVAFKHKVSDNFLTRMKQELIKKWTKSNYFHVEIVIGDNWIEADNDIGLVKHKLRPYSDKYDYIDIEIPDCAVNIDNVNSFIDSQMGAKYDWTGIYLSQVIKLGVDRKNRWFCSELVSRIMQMYGIEVFQYIKPENVSPQGVFELLMTVGELS